MVVIRIVGKASKVFDAIKFLADKAGKLTIGELVRLKSK
jgi:hypothetical protein